MLRSSRLYWNKRGKSNSLFIEDGNIALVNFNSRDGIHIARIGVDWFYGK